MKQMSDTEKQKTANRWARELAFIWADMFSNQNCVGTQAQAMGLVRRSAIMLNPAQAGYCSPGNLQQILKDAAESEATLTPETPKKEEKKASKAASREALEAQAKELGITVRSNMKTETIKAKIEEAQNG